MLLELLWGPQQRGMGRGEGKTLSLVELVGAFFIVAAHQFRLVIQKIQVWRRARQVQVDHPLGRGCKVRIPGSQWIDEPARDSRSGPCPQSGQGHRPQSQLAVTQEMTTGQLLKMLDVWSHDSIPVIAC